MSILISGDFHSNITNEINQITKKALIEKYQQDKYEQIKYHIILGDGCFLWPGNEEKEAINNYVLSQRPFPVLCVMGNHDPVMGRKDLPEADIGIGEKVIIVNMKDPFIAYLKRGKIYTIENHRFLVLGGALSIYQARIANNICFWKEEYWSEKEKDDLFKILEKDIKFDYVLSNTGPNQINSIIASKFKLRMQALIYDDVAVLNDKIDNNITCKQWFCGHWHKDRYYYNENLKRGYQYLWNKTALLTNNEILII